MSTRAKRASLNLCLSFYEETEVAYTWGSNHIAYSVTADIIKGIIEVCKIGAFGDREFMCAKELPEAEKDQLFGIFEWLSESTLEEFLNWLEEEFK